MGMLVRRCLGQLRDVGDNGLDHPGQRSDLLGEIEERLSRHDGRPRPGVMGESPGSRGASAESRAEVSARPIFVRVHKSANVGGGRNFLWVDAPSGVFDGEFGRCVPGAISGMAILHTSLSGDERG
ncbi:hypothetical protein B296_00014369 [Ensete ventricosum]|uniref:Uncharacterized protein n=1 Tax=Ensete ventricosum TaxID=4639 RepID=A0A426Y2Z8_ENSVE|nr:hypothetical protein B296_00014369 [Ensete ventricosum]